MPITYRPAIRPRERILSFGVQGTGKSNAPLTIARRCPDATFYVIDTDYSESYEVALETDFTDLENVEVHKVPYDDWDAQLAAVNDVRSRIGENDWLIFDSMSATWGAIQDWFINNIFDQGSAEYFMEVRKKKEETKGKKDKDAKSLGALEGWMDWPVINKNYFPLYAKLTSIVGHLYMTAEQGQTSDDDDREVKKLFGPYGVKPVGQKKIGYVPRTVLLMTKSRVGEYAVTTIKDRNRVELEDHPIEDFSKDYLVGVAGWKPKRIEVA